MRNFLHKVPHILGIRREKKLVPDLDYLLKYCCMTSDFNFEFIAGKIATLRTAVMYSMSNSLVKLPNDIVTSLKVDEDGQLWFLSHLPSQPLSECEQVFPVRLHFFRKGYDFFVEVSGKATIMNNSFSDNSFNSSDVNNKKYVLIKMTMSNIEYTEPHTNKNKTKVEQLAGKCYQWMLGNFGFHHSSVAIFDKMHQSH